MSIDTRANSLIMAQSQTCFFDDPICHAFYECLDSFIGYNSYAVQVDNRRSENCAICYIAVVTTWYLGLSSIVRIETMFCNKRYDLYI